MNIKKQPKPNQCPAMRCIEPTDGGKFCPRHQAQVDRELGPGVEISIIEDPHTIVTASTQAQVFEGMATRKAEQAKSLAEEHVQALADFVITSEDDMALANGLLLEAKNQAKAIDVERKSWTDPLNAQIKRLNAMYQPVIKLWGQVEGILKTKIADAVRATQQAQDEALTMIAESGGEVVGEVLAVAHGQELVEPPSNISIRQEWDVKIVDIDLIPIGYMQPNFELIQRVVRQSNGAVTIPGVEVIERDVVIARSK